MAAILLVSGAPFTTIPEVQGTGDRSAFEGSRVTLRGRVTAVDRRGFYLQHTAPTSHEGAKGLYVYTNGKQLPTKDDYVEVTGDVTEFKPSRAPHDHTTTQLAGEVQVKVLPTMQRGGGVPPPAEPIRIAADGDSLHPPTQTAREGIDFWKNKLEGTLVTIDEALVVGATKRGEIHVVPSLGRGATGLTPDGALYQAEGDANPELIRVTARLAGGMPELAVGSVIRGGLTGVVTYRNGAPSLELTEAPKDVEAKQIPDFKTSLRATDTHMVMASMNVENLDPSDSKYPGLAHRIVDGYNSPDLIALQEIQDNDGATNSDKTKADLTVKRLIDEIKKQGGPDYEYVEIPPKDDQDGGQPGGNIRVGYLFRKDRVALEDNTMARVGENHPAFADSRKSLRGSFKFLPTGETLTAFNSHFASKWGSTPEFGTVQPPIVGKKAQRLAQAGVVHGEMKELLKQDPKHRVVSLGDMNQRSYEHPTARLSGNAMVNLTLSLPEKDRATYIFRGNQGSIDHAEVPVHMIGQVKIEVDPTNPRLPAGDSRKVSDHGSVLLEIDMRPRD